MAPRSVFLIVVTDADGTLLDHDTYSFAAARPALIRLEHEGVPIILCSSKTRAEIEALQRELGIAHPFVSENGGALFVPDGYFPFPLPGARPVDGYHAFEFGRPYAEVVNALHRSAEALGVRVTGFSDMTDDEVACACRLPVARAHLARLREYDEPFSIPDATPWTRLCLCNRLRDAGLQCTSGGRFHHVTGATDKARAIGVLRMLYRRALSRAHGRAVPAWMDAREGGDSREAVPGGRPRIVTVGLGDAPNDAAMLREVEIPIVVRNGNPEWVEAMLAEVPHARVSDRQGAAGWNETVERIVRELS